MYIFIFIYIYIYLAKCKYVLPLLKGLILTALTSSLATFIVLYVNEKNEKESLRDKLKLYFVCSHSMHYIYIYM